MVRLKLKLCLSCFFFSLALNVFTNHFFVDSYSGNKIAFALNSFLVLVDLFKKIELSVERSTGIFLDCLCYHTDRVFRGDYHIQMNMIWLYSNFYISPVGIILSYFLEFDLQDGFLLLEPRSFYDNELFRRYDIGSFIYTVWADLYNFIQVSNKILH